MRTWAKALHVPDACVVCRVVRCDDLVVLAVLAFREYLAPLGYSLVPDEFNVLSAAHAGVL